MNDVLTICIDILYIRYIDSLRKKTMTNIDKSRIKQLIRDTFWQFKNIPDSKLTPKLFRDWAGSNLDHRIITATAIMVHGRGFWIRAENLCCLYKQLRYWHKLPN